MSTFKFVVIVSGDCVDIPEEVVENALQDYGYYADVLTREKLSGEDLTSE